MEAFLELKGFRSNRNELDKRCCIDEMELAKYGLVDSPFITDNDKNVGKDCLTWWYKNSRTKIYNKVLCQFTSSSV